MSWHEELRAKFPAARSYTYLNSAAAGPIAFPVARAGASVYESLLMHGDAEWEQMLSQVESTRRSMARLVHCRSDELAFTRNTSHSASLVAQMLWDVGKRSAVALEDEFPASTLPFLNRGFDVQFVKSDGGRYPYERIASALEGRDVLISSHVMYRTGQVLDPKRLVEAADSAGAHLMLTVTQSLGALEVDFAGSNASFLIGTSHKWMCAGYGGGFLAVHHDLLSEVRWPQVGWMSQKRPDEMRNDALDLQQAARAVEGGSHPFAPLAALGAAANLWLDTGPAQVQERVRGLTKALRARLRTAGFETPDAPDEELSGITIVPIDNAQAVVRALAEQRIETTPRGAGVRLSVHAFNNEADLDKVVEALSHQRRLQGA